MDETDRKASRLRARACSDEARADAHAMLAHIAEARTDTDKAAAATAAIPHAEDCLKLAAVDQQRLQARRPKSTPAP